MRQEEQLGFCNSEGYIKIRCRNPDCRKVLSEGFYLVYYINHSGNQFFAYELIPCCDENQPVIVLAGEDEQAIQACQEVHTDLTGSNSRFLWIPKEAFLSNSVTMRFNVPVN